MIIFDFTMEKGPSIGDKILSSYVGIIYNEPLLGSPDPH